MAALTPDQLGALADRFYYLDDTAQYEADKLNKEHDTDLSEHGLIFAVAMVFCVPIDDLEDAHIVAPPSEFKAYEIPTDNQQQLELFEWLHQFSEAARGLYRERRRQTDRELLRMINQARIGSGNPEIEVYTNTVERASKIVLVPRPTSVIGPNGTKFAK